MGTQKSRLNEIRDANIYISIIYDYVFYTLQNKFSRALCRILRMPLYRLAALQHRCRVKKRETAPKTTMKSNNWVTVWRDWARYRNTQPGAMAERGLPIPEDSADFNT